MLNSGKISEFCIEALLETGIEQAVCNLSFTRKTELTVDAEIISLLRTTDDVNLSLTGIREDKKGFGSINKTDEKSIRNCVIEVGELVDASEPDPANGIAEEQPHESFSRGSEKPDIDLMYTRMKTFLEYSREKYPTLILEQVILDHTASHKSYQNSNGVSFNSVQGRYNFFAMFTSKVGSDASSFNFAAVATEDLSSELHTGEGLDRLMNQSTEQTSTENLQGSFVGDVLITPECMGSFISIIARYLSDYPLITGTSIFKDSLEESIADEKLSLHSKPLSEEMAAGYFFSNDGFKAENSTIIEKGVLKSFLLGLYGSRKTGLEKAVNSGGCYVVDPGDADFNQMVKSIDKGILLCRFSGGNPSSSGDFSGVAKNSYYIENGEIKYPVSETMVAGNLKEMLNNIRHISSERVNNGGSIIPWITFSGVTVSGK